MTDDLPADVRTVLGQLFAEARAALDAGDRETALAAVGSAETVAATKLPEGDRRDRLLLACERVRALLDSDEADGWTRPDAPDGADPAPTGGEGLENDERFPGGTGAESDAGSVGGTGGTPSGESAEALAAECLAAAERRVTEER